MEARYDEMDVSVLSSGAKECARVVSHLYAWRG